jgi:hypothetical protein
MKHNVGEGAMLSRRDLVGKLMAGAAAACAVGVAQRSVAATRRQATAASGDPGDAEAAAPPIEPLARSADSRDGLSPVHDRLAASPSTAPSAPPPWELLRPLAAGSLVAHGWSVVDLTAPDDGACVLTLRNQHGRAHRVHLCRNDGRPSGLVYTQQVDLVVMNGGQGDLPTDEGLAQAVAKVAHTVATNEANRRHEPMLTALLSQRERAQRFADAAKLR